MKTKTIQRAFGFMNRGGKRRGAGRKPKGERAGVSHAKRPKLAERHPVLVTLRLQGGLPSMRDDEVHAELKRALALASKDDFRVLEYSVQSNHVHFIAESKDERALTLGMRGLTVRIARLLNRLWRRVGRVFSDRYHALILTTPRAVRNALVYVIQNARKHGAWVAKRPDAYSSGPEFGGWRDQRFIAKSKPRLLARAKTWLLALGWRKHGLIELLERPADG